MSDRPTPEDMGRSLEADLALCEAEPKGLDSLQRWERELFCLARTGWPAAIRRALAAEAEVKRLKKLLDRDHTGLAAALVACRRVARSYGWIPDGEWGCYEYHERTEEALREEVGRAFAEIDSLSETALQESGTRAGAAFVPERDKLAAAEAEVARLRAVLDGIQKAADDSLYLGDFMDTTMQQIETNARAALGAHL